MSDVPSRLSAAKRQLLQKRLHGKSAAAGQTVSRPANAEPYQLSFAQQRLWFIERFEEGNVAYNIPFAFRLRGQLHLAALERSLEEIVRRHEILRTSFRSIDGKPEAVVQPRLVVPLSVKNLQDIPPEQRESEFETMIQQDARQPFDLENPPLFRHTLLRFEEREYILLMTIHHIIFDGWSVGVFMQELTLLYNQYSHGKPLSLPTLPIQYGDFARWQREWLTGETLDRQRTYWKKQLLHCPSLLELPTDHPRPARQTFRGATCSFLIPDVVAASLCQLNQQEKNTLFITLLTAFNILLYRYSGQEDILIGSPVANRHRSEFEGLIGFFVNMLVLRTDLSGNPSFRELLKQVRATTLDAQAHQDMPFDLLVENLAPERNLSHQPLFQVAFAFRDEQVQPLKFSHLTVEPIPIFNGATKFDLFLEMTTTRQGLCGMFEYNSDLFEPATIQRMITHFQTLLHSIATHPEQRIAELPILTEDEQRQLLIEWNTTTTDYPKHATIQALFERQAEQTPDALALVTDNTRMTYRQLNNAANQLAHSLRRSGVGAETLVGLCMERSLDMLVALLGILKAGGAYVPFDPTYPSERLSFMLEDTQVAVVLTQSHLVEKLPPNHARVMCVDAENAFASESPENPTHAGTPDNVAYVMYTSGSTGKPKGVCVTHRGVVRLVKATNYAELTAQDTFLQFAPISFDASTFEIWGSLLNGAQLVLMPAGTPSLEELGRVIRQQHVTILWLTAGLFHLMVEKQLDALRSVRQLLAGGDVLSVPHVQRVLKEIPTCTLINGYGPTESTTFACCYPIPRSDQLPVSVPIGRPIANTEAYILDRHLQPVPIGVTGELYLGGAGLAREYLHRPKLTQERFAPHPFSDSAEARLYKTGDLVRYRPDGTIEFLGRLDYQVKIRGFRIEPGEIEHCLLQHSAVREALVLVRRPASGEPSLAAYIVTKQECQITVGDLRDFLKTRVPDYMIPATFTTLAAFPLTPNGKVDRRALPEPDAERGGAADTFVAPRNQAEERMAELWKSILSLTTIGIYDDFFEAGGHSLLLIRLVADIEQVFQVRLPLYQFFETPTIAGLVQAIQRAAWQGKEPAVLETQAIDIAAETTLDEHIRVEEGVGSAPLDPQMWQAVFLTGATGFLGAFLLHELLQQTNAAIYCLVRAASVAEGKQRLKKTLQHYLIWSEPLRDRIIPVCGDLAQPLLGLSSEEFDTLAKRVDVIYHSGAQVNLLYPYSALKAANVLGTQEALRLAAQAKIKPIHYLSTVGVFPADYAPDGEPITEDAPLPAFDDLQIGYAQSKWVAEKLVAAAFHRGIPCAIYRPSRIAGHSQTGVWNTSDFACRMIKSCIQTGIAPQQQINSENWAPVDYVSQALIHLSIQPSSKGQVFHLVNRHPLNWEELLAWIHAFGYPLKTLSYIRWRRELCERVPDNELTPLLPLFQTASPATVTQRFAYWNTVAGLEGTPITCPQVNHALLYTYFAYFLRHAFLCAPHLVN